MVFPFAVNLTASDEWSGGGQGQGPTMGGDWSGRQVRRVQWLAGRVRPAVLRPRRADDRDREETPRAARGLSGILRCPVAPRRRTCCTGISQLSSVETLHRPHCRPAAQSGARASSAARSWRGCMQRFLTVPCTLDLRWRRPAGCRRIWGVVVDREGGRPAPSRHRRCGHGVHRRSGSADRCPVCVRATLDARRICSSPAAAPPKTRPARRAAAARSKVLLALGRRLRACGEGKRERAGASGKPVSLSTMPDGP
jgi:hypothetical protein